MSDHWRPLSDQISCGLTKCLSKGLELALDIRLKQVPAIGGASTDTLDDPSFTGHDVTPSLRQESSSEVLPDSPSQDLVSTPTASPCESHPPAFFSVLLMVFILSGTCRKRLGMRERSPTWNQFGA